MTSSEGTVTKELPVPDSEDLIILLDPEHSPPEVQASHPFPNILRVSRSGDVLWYCALLPQETAWKCYLSVE